MYVWRLFITVFFVKANKWKQPQCQMETASVSSAEKRSPSQEFIAGWSPLKGLEVSFSEIISCYQKMHLM